MDASIKEILLESLNDLFKNDEKVSINKTEFDAIIVQSESFHSTELIFMIELANKNNSMFYVSSFYTERGIIYASFS